MSVAVLGPLIVDGGSLSPRERAVLAGLVLDVGRAVSADQLADAVWGDDPPKTWPKQLQASIGRLRRAIGDRTIETVAGGYVLALDPDSIDARLFERLAAVARTHLENGDPARAIDALDRSLALWRGAPYADLASWDRAVAESERLGELRLSAEDLRLEARSALGAHESVVADAERLVREQPLREPRWAILATALYRSGRQADALAAIRAAGERLGTELGIEPGERLRALEIAILRQDPGLDVDPLPIQASTACPYRGLQPFGVDDEDDFFGRDADIGVVLARLSRAPFLAISGASGSGKSSLVRAGIVPVLRRRGDRIALLVPEPDLDVRIRDAARGPRPVDVLIVDQFEEVFHAPEQDVDAAARAIADVIGAGTTVVLVVRSDYLDDCAAHPDLAQLIAEAVLLVGPMAPESVRETIEQPARRAGLRLESGLVEVILRDAVGQGGALPHLSHALVETWLRREGATLTVAGYEASGGISGAIAQSADRLYLSMDAAQRGLCRSLLLRMVALSPDGNPVRRRVPTKPLRMDIARDAVLTLLARSRLVSAEAESVEVAHESLATAWPRLKSWLEEDAESTRLLTAVSAAAEAWQAAGRPADDLYRGARLQSALEWRGAAPRDLTGLEMAFLDESSARATAERDELAERGRRDRRQNHRLRWLLAAAAALIVLLGGAGTAAVVASGEADRQRDRATIEALVGTALALRGSERDVSALLAAEAYRRWPDDARARMGLMGVLQGAGGFLGNAFIPDTDDVFGAVIPGTERVFVTEGEGFAAIREASTGEIVREIDLGITLSARYPYPLVAVSEDGSTGAVFWPGEIDPDGPTWYGRVTTADLVVVDLSTGERLLGPEHLEVGSGALAIDADGTTVAIADWLDGSVTLVDVATGRRGGIVDESTVPLEVDSYAVALAFDRGGRLLVGRLDDRVEIVDPSTRGIVGRIAVPVASANVAMDVLPSGMVVASGDRGITAIDPSMQEVRWARPLRALNPASCAWIVGAEHAGRVYCGGQFGRMTEYDLADGEPTGVELDSLLGGVGPLAVTLDGTELVAISATRGAISRWRLDGSGAANRLIAPGEFLLGGYAHDGHAVVTARPKEGALDNDAFTGVTVRSPSTGEVLRTFPVPIATPSWVGSRAMTAWFPEDDAFRLVDAATLADIGAPLPGDPYRSWTTHKGTRVYVLGSDERIRAIDGTTGEAMRDAAIEVEGWPIWLSASPDGRRLAVSSLSGNRQIVSIADAATGAIVTSAQVEIGTQVLFDDGSLIGTDDNRITRWDTTGFVRTGSLPGTAGGLGIPTLSDDGTKLLMTAGDGSIMLYDTATGLRLAEPFRAAGQNFTGGFLRPDGLELAYSDPAGVMVWDLDPAHQFEAVCRIAGRNLTDDEWRTYLAQLGEPRSTCGFE